MRASEIIYSYSDWTYKKYSPLKGTVTRDFSPLVFFFKQLPLAPVDKPNNEFDFFRIFAEMFDFSGAWKRIYYSWMILSNFEWTLLRSNIYWWLLFYWLFLYMHWRTAKGPTGASTGSMTPAMHALPVSLTPANRCQRHRWHASPMSLTPANACFAGVNDTGEEFFAGVVDTGEAL
jgi:hypothetical protein